MHLALSRLISASPQRSLGWAALACLLLGVGCDGSASSDTGGGPPSAPPITVQVVTVERQPLDQALTAVGSLQSPETTVISADMAGILIELNIPEGRLVERGHLLARLDAQVPKAVVSVAEARERRARAELERIKPLYDDGVVPRQQYDNAVAELDTAIGILTEASSRYDRTEVRAPFTGVLSLRTAQLGQYVSSGEPIVEITKIQPLELVFSVPEAEATKLRVGQAVEGHVGRCGESFDAVIEALDPTVDRATRTLAIQARVDNRDGSLRPGMSARVRIIVGTIPEAIVVPHEALIRQGRQYLVYVVENDQVAPQRAVVPAEFFTDGVRIADGLAAGEVLVVTGHQKLRPGAPVLPSPWTPTDNPVLRLGDAAGEDCL